ncbi:MAG: tetratricopeptide repeat protein [Cyanobacteria bacterium TGS_CYA1]|nr:tetratricopeptide repeat protein [Cyanobacteria bacterium TGS_CYA1]
MMANLKASIKISKSIILAFAWIIGFNLGAIAASGDDEITQARQAENAGRIAEAEAKYLDAIEKFKESKRNIPLSFAFDRLANIYLRQNKLDKAANAYANCIENSKATIARGTDDSGNQLTEQASKLLNKDLGLAMVALGSTYTRQEKFSSAEPILIEATKTIKAALNADHDCVGVALSAIGDLKFAQGKPEEAAEYYQQALAIRKSITPRTTPQLVY